MRADADEIVNAVREVLNKDGLARAATGELHRFGYLVDSVERPCSILERYDVTLHTAEITAADETTATVEVDATINGAMLSVIDTRSTWKTRLQGTAQLVRQESEWKVTDLYLNGESVLESFFERELGDSTDGVKVKLLVGRINPPAVRLYLEVENSAGRPVPIRHAGIGVPRRGRGWRWHSAVLGTDQVEPGVSRVEATTNVKGIRPGGEVRLVFECGSGVVDLRPPAARHRSRAPLRARSPVLCWVTTVVAYATGVGLLARVAFGVDPLFMAAFVLVFLSAGALLRLVRQARRKFSRVFVPWFGAALGMTAAGAVLLIADTGLSVFGRVRACFDYLFVNWWGLGLLLLYVALGRVTTHRPRALRRLRRSQAVWLTVSLAVAAIGFVLVVRNGGFALLTPSGLERHNVRRYIQSALPGADIRSMKKISTRRVDGCRFEVWQTSTSYGRFWVVTNFYDLLPQSAVKTVDRAVAFHVRIQRAIAISDAREQGKPRPLHPAPCER